MSKRFQKPILAASTVLDIVPFGVGDTPIFAMRLTPPDWKDWTPGQFVMIRKPGLEASTLWGRPFSICRVSPNNLVIFFQVTGRATSEMTRLQAGDKVDIWGPLGNGLAVEKDGPTLLLAGGVGIAPFVGYVESHPSPWNINMKFGHRLPLDCYPLHSVNEKIMVDTFQEKVPEDLPRFIELLEQNMIKHKDKIKASKSGTGLVLACGPDGFLKTVQGLAAKHKLRTQLCLEHKMACGVGACLGCVVKTKPKSEKAQGPAYVPTCTRGPVFWAEEIIL